MVGEGGADMRERKGAKERKERREENQRIESKENIEYRVGGVGSEPAESWIPTGR